MAWMVVAFLIVLVTVRAGAVDDNQLQERFDQLQAQTNQARGLALAILKRIKTIDIEYRTSDGQPKIGEAPAVRTELGKIQPIKESFEQIAGGTLSELEEFDKELAKADESSNAASLKTEAGGLKEDIQKYQKYVDRFYRKTVDDFGEPMTTMVLVSGERETGGRLVFSGEASGGFGAAKYKRPNASPIQDVSGSDLNLGVNGRYLLSSRTNLVGSFNHQSTVERREISTTDFGASIVHSLNDKMTGSAGLELSSFNDKETDAADFSDVKLFAKYQLSDGQRKVDAEISNTSRGYGDNENLDYSITRLFGKAQLPVGTGLMNLQLVYQKKSHEDILDYMTYSEFSPSMVYQLTPGGSELGVSYQAFSHPEVDDSPLDNTRLKAHYYSVTKTQGRTVKFGPEFYWHKLPNAEDDEYDGFYDFTLMKQVTTRTNRAGLSRWEINYRMFSDSTRFDFAQLTYRKDSRPLGSGYFSKFKTAARFYVETSYKSDSVYDPSSGGRTVMEEYCPAHTLDLYWNFGWSKTARGFLRQLSIGPVLGARFYFDQNGEDRSNKETDEDFILQNPANVAKAGIEAVLAGATTTGITWRADGSYVLTALYNADPKTTTGVFQLNGQVTYQINVQWLVEGYLKFHQTRMDEASAIDLDKSDIGVRVRYLFDVVR